MTLCFVYSTDAMAASSSNLQAKIRQEEKNAALRKASLQKLTEEERTLNKDLAEAEKRIQLLEQGIETHQKKLEELVVLDETERVAYEKLLQELQKTENVQTETLKLLWEISCRRTTVGGREMADWAIIDREFVWSQALFSSLQAYRLLLDTQEAELAAVLGRRDKISEEVKGRLNVVNDEKGALLKARVEYSKRLAEVRQLRKSDEEALAETMKLIEELNFTLDEKQGALVRQKGKLPWPVKGKLAKEYSLKGATPYRGVGFTAEANQPVSAIGAGIVVHSGILRGFGTVVVLQHGEEYFSLYAYLGQSSVDLGASVKQGQELGKTGYYPLLQSDGMYFELRFKQKAINPNQWLETLK